MNVIRKPLPWTDYPEIDQILSKMLSNAKHVLNEPLLAFILHGSLAAGGFDPQRSDVDFVVVTERLISEEQFMGLAETHSAINTSGLPWSSNVEGSYIPEDALRRHDPGNNRFPALRCDGSFGWDDHGADWVLQRWNIREFGISLYGLGARDLIDPIAAEEMRAAVMGILRGWWEPMLTNEYRLGEAEYQAYAVMTMCRSFYTMQTARVAPKMEATKFARQHLGAPWAELIDEACCWRQGEVMQRKQAVKAFIRFTIDACEERMRTNLQLTKIPRGGNK